MQALVTAKENKQGKIEIVAVTDDVGGIPDGWEKLSSWLDSGWVVASLAGNREHDFGMLMEKPDAKAK